MEVVNRHAAGIDVGSRSHFVAVGQQPEDVREFGVYNEDLREMVRWLKEHEITTVAMESTGTYWQSLFFCSSGIGSGGVSLQRQVYQKHQGQKDRCAGLPVDTEAALGLLSSSFLPDQATEQLRTYCRHRTWLLETAAVTTLKMQKYLRLLNLRLDIVVKDVTGLTGMSIIEAICMGN